MYILHKITGVFKTIPINCNKDLTMKNDVYKFGVVIVKLVC